MFEMFSEQARGVVANATAEAMRLGHQRMGTEDLLLGLLADGDGSAARALASAGVTLEAARHKVIEAVGPAAGADTPSADHLPFTPRAKRALARASRFAIQRSDRHVEPEHVLLGVLDVEGTAAQVLRGLGVDLAALTTAIAPGPAAKELAVPVAVQPADAASPRCSGCGSGLDTALAARTMTVRAGRGQPRTFVVAYCSACGSTIGVVPG